MPRPITTTHQQAISENERLLEAANALDARWPRNERTASEVRSQWLQALTEFRSHLKSHFAAEEQAGYFADVLSVAPELTSQVESLLRQHSTLAAALDRLILMFGSNAADGQQLIAEHQLFHELIAELKRHETAENSLVLEVADRDIGVGD